MALNEKDLLTELLESSTRDVLRKFEGFKGALVDTLEDPLWVYVPGSRKSDRLLLVAHADTVNGDHKVKVKWVGGVATLGRSKGASDYLARALGGDDRTGCAAMLLLLQEYQAFGHSVLITTGEESGLRGARSAAHILKEQLSAHSFAVEMDRRGVQNYVFYSQTSTDAFEKHVEEKLQGWEKDRGSSSDIAAICPEVSICGVNIAAGYFGEHSSTEMVVLDCWRDSLETLKKWVSAEKHAPFAWKEKPPVVIPVYHGVGHGGPSRRWAGTNGAHQHTFRWRSDCQASVCEAPKCGMHERYKQSVTREYPWTDCDYCKLLVRTRQEKVVTIVHAAEKGVGLAEGRLTVFNRNVLEWSVEHPGFLSKKMKKRVAKLLLADDLLKKALLGVDRLLPRPKEEEEKFGDCLVCGYSFRAVKVCNVASCPKCHHNPNFKPEAGATGSRVGKVVAGHHCSECGQYVTRDIDHAYACSSYPNKVASTM